MKPSREPYGKCACAFTDGFTLSFPASATASTHDESVLRFEHNWFSHFGSSASDAAHALFPPRHAMHRRIGSL